METNVLIAGAGPTALTLEIDRARRGFEVRIVDKAAEFFAGSRGDGIQSRTLEVFDDLGVIDHVLTHGSLPPIIHAHRGGKFVGEWWMSDHPTFAEAYNVAALDVTKDAHAQPVPRLMPMLPSVADPKR